MLCYRQFGSLTEKVADYERLLRDLMSRASLDDADMIKSMLDRVRAPSALERCTRLI